MMDVQTYSGEVLISVSYSDFLAEDYAPNEMDAKLMRLVTHLYERYVDSATYLPTEVMSLIGAEIRFSHLAVNGEHHTSEEPLIVAGPWRYRDGDVDTSDRWAVLVWLDVGYSAPWRPPDYTMVLEDVTRWGDTPNELLNITDLTPTIDVHCTRNEEHTWQYMTDGRAYETFADVDGSRCPECGSALAASCYMGDNSHTQYVEIPWNGAMLCECGHDDHFGRVCGETWLSRTGEPCECVAPFENEDDFPVIPPPQCEGQEVLALPQAEGEFWRYAGGRRATVVQTGDNL